MKSVTKIIISLLVVLTTTITTTYAENEIKLEGIFQGENLFVMNPFASSGVGFCIFEVSVNGKVSTDEINCSAFEIDLSVYHLTKGDPIAVIIKHKEGCTPKVLNADVLKPKSTFSVVTIKADKTGNITWTTKDEIGSLPFIVEQFKWKKWIAIGQVQGKGVPTNTNYSLKVGLHSGINKFRVKQIDYTKKPRLSPEVTINNLQPEVTFTPGNNGKTSGSISFSRATDYEIYDFYGKRLAKGNGTMVNVSSFPKGTYFINYDCKSESFEKK
ncbi:MAG: hypothetical protein MJ211_07010 [Bacteroidales bacterium]|nr:hypothetical protein [Bacteroidales bacterium]